MKKLILLALAAVMMVGCERDNKAKEEVKPFSVIEVDSCEYLYYTMERGYAGFGFLAHKGNCKYCAERRKRELEILIKQISEK